LLTTLAKPSWKFRELLLTTFTYEVGFTAIFQMGTIYPIT